MQPNRREVLAGASLLAVGMVTSVAEARSPSRSLLILGDWGRESAPRQRDVAAQMEIAAAETPCVGVVAVGDNFYEDGVVSVDDPKWNALFETMYTGPHLRPLPWYAALGNHDYGGAPQAQVDYSAKSDRWRMPARYYKISEAQLGLPDTELFVLDTNPLVAENYDGDGEMAKNVRTQDAQAQLAWLERELAASQAKYKLVAGHHPIHSGGSLHGDTPDLIRTLKPVLRRYGVMAYLAGHDHDLQHIVRDGLHCVDSGAGCEARPVSAINGTQFCAAKPGFALLTLTQTGLELQFRDDHGATLYHTILV